MRWLVLYRSHRAAENKGVPPFRLKVVVIQYTISRPKNRRIDATQEDRFSRIEMAGWLPVMWLMTGEVG
jgi:hypothetical protein